MFQLARVFTLALAAVTAAIGSAVDHFQPGVHPAGSAYKALSAFHEDERWDFDRQIFYKQIDEEVQAQREKELAEIKARAEAEALAAAARAQAEAAAGQARMAQQRISTAAVSAAPAANYGSGAVQDIIRQAFAPYGAGAVDWGLRVARCESGYNPRAVNPAGYYGLFQFAPATFRATPYGGGDIFDPVANANAAAWKYAHDGPGAWGCK